MATVLNSRGIKHPDTFNDHSGETQYSAEIDSINESIRLILTTAPGELFGDPAFGSRLHEYFFEFAGSQLDTMIKEEIVRALNQYETRIFVQDSDISIDYILNEKRVVISIDYRLRYTDMSWSYQHIVYVNKEDNLNYD